MNRGLVAAACVVFAVGAPRFAAAAEPTRVLFGPIAEPEGETGPDGTPAMHVDVERVADQVASATREALDARFELVGDRARLSKTCATDRSCWLEEGRALDADFLVWPTMTTAEGDVHLTFEVLDGAAGTRLATIQDTCELCGAAEMDEFVAIATGRAAAQLEEVQPEPTALVVAGSPHGAAVYVDGRRVGQLPWQGEVAPGLHEVSVRKSGYVTTVRRVSAPEGSRASAAFDLVRDPGVRRRRMRWAGWGLVAGGAVTTIGGAVLLGLDGRDHTRSCSDPDAEGNCPFRYESTGLGAGLTAAGVVMAGVGTGLLVYEKRHDGKVKARAYLRPSPTKVRLKVNF